MAVFVNSANPFGICRLLVPYQTEVFIGCGCFRARKQPFVCYPVDFTEAKRPLEGGPLFSAGPEGCREDSDFGFFLPLIDLAATYSPAS